MKPIRRKNAWTWSKPCSCCAQFDADQKNKKIRSQAPPEDVVPDRYPTLHSLIARTMNWYYGYGSAYGRGVQN
jgi:hypothetical protein